MNTQTIAKTIWDQCNARGNAIPMSWGCHALKALPEGTKEDFKMGGLQFMVYGALFRGHVRVILNWNDTYIVRFGHARKGEFNLKEEQTGIYDDMLPQVIDYYVETPEGDPLRDQVRQPEQGYDGFNVDDLEIFLMSDQPMTCPHCGARSEELQEYPNGRQLHLCTNENCMYGYFLVEDDEPHPPTTECMPISTTYTHKDL